LWLVTGDERLLSTTFFVFQNVHSGFEVFMDREGTRLAKNVTCEKEKKEMNLSLRRETNLLKYLLFGGI